MDDELKGTLLVLLTALESGVAIVVNRFFVLRMDPVLFTAIRALLIGLAFLALTNLTNAPKKVPIKKMAILGIMGGGLAFLLFFMGLPLTTGGRAAFIHKTLPVWASLLAYLFLRERVTRRQTWAIAASLVGLAVMQIDVITASVRWGDVLVLGATLLWAVENLLAKHFMNLGETNWRVTFSRMFFGSLVLFSVATLQGKLGLLMSLQPIQWAYVLISTALLAWYVLTWYSGIKYINLSKATGLLLISPVISLVLGFAMLGEEVSLLQLLGSGLILVGCYVLARSRSRVNLNEPV